MNWMGGARRRISSKNSGTESKQRLFFEQQRRKRLERESRQQQGNAESTEESEFCLPFESPIDVHRRHKKNFSLDILQLSSAAPTTTPRSSRRKVRRRRSKDDEDDDEDEEDSDEDDDEDVGNKTNCRSNTSTARRSAKKSASSRKQFDPSQEFRRLAMTSGSAKKRSASKRKTPASRTKARRSARLHDVEEDDTEEGDDSCDKLRRFLPEANESFTRPNPPRSGRRSRTRSAFTTQGTPVSTEFTLSTPRVTFADELMGPASEMPDEAGSPCDIPMGTPAQHDASNFSMGPNDGIFSRSTSFQCDPSRSPRDDARAESRGFQCGPAQSPPEDAFVENTSFQCDPTQSPPDDAFTENTGFQCGFATNFGRSSASHSNLISATEEQVDMQDGSEEDEDLDYAEPEQGRGFGDKEGANVEEDDEHDVEMCTQRDDEAFPEAHTPMIRGFSLGSKSPQPDRVSSKATIGPKVRFSGDLALGKTARQPSASPRTPMWALSGEDHGKSPREQNFRFGPQPTPNIDMGVGPQTPLEERSVFASSSWASSLAPEKPRQTKRRFCQSSKKIKPPISALGPTRPGSLRLPNTFPKLQNSAPRTARSLPGAQDAHPKRLKFSGFPTPACDGTPATNPPSTQAQNSTSKKRPIEKRSSASATRPKKKLSTPVWLEAMLKTTKTASQLSNSMKDGDSTNSKMFSSLIGTDEGQEPKIADAPSSLSGESADKCEKSETLQEPTLNLSETENCPAQQISTDDDDKGSDSGEDSSYTDGEELLAVSEDAGCIEDIVVDLEVPGTPFQPVPRTPVAGIDLHPAASPQVHLDEEVFKHANKPQPVNTELQRGLDEDPAPSPENAKRRRSSPMSLKPQSSVKFARRRSLSSSQGRNMGPPSPVVSSASSDVILSQSSPKHLLKGTPLFPKVFTSHDDRKSSRGQDSSVADKFDSSKTKRKLSAHSSTKSHTDSADNTISDESENDIDRRDREFAEIMKKLRAHEGCEEELMSTNDELAASVVEMKNERTRPVDASSSDKPSASTVHPPEAPTTSSARGNETDASSSAVRTPSDVSTRRNNSQQKQAPAQLLDLCTNQTANVSVTSESFKGAALEEQEPRKSTKTSSERQLESDMLASRISRLEKGYVLLIGRNVQLQTENSELLARVHKLEAAAQHAAQLAASNGANNNHGSALALPGGPAFGGAYAPVPGPAHRFTSSSSSSYSQRGFGVPFQTGGKGTAQPMVINITTSHLAMNTLVPENAKKEQPTASGAFDDEPQQPQHRPSRSPKRQRASNMLSLSPQSSPQSQKKADGQSDNTKRDSSPDNENLPSNEDRVRDSDIERILRKVRADHEKANAKIDRLKLHAISNKENRNPETNDMRHTDKRASVQDTDVEDIVRRVLAKASTTVTTPAIPTGSFLSNTLRVRECSKTSVLDASRYQQPQKSAEVREQSKEHTKNCNMLSGTKMLAQAVPMQGKQTRSKTPSSDLQVVPRSATFGGTNSCSELSMTTTLSQSAAPRHAQSLFGTHGSGFQINLPTTVSSQATLLTKREEKLDVTKVLTQGVSNQLKAHESNFRVVHRATFASSRRSNFEMSPLRPRKLRALPAPESQDPECPSRSRFPALKWTSEDDDIANAVSKSTTTNNKSTMSLASSRDLLVVRRC